MLPIAVLRRPALRSVLPFVLVLVLVTGGLASADAGPTGHAAKSCRSFVAYRGSDVTYVASRVTRHGRVSCSRARRMIRSTYGSPGGYKRVQPPVGRMVVYWRGGWRCSNGAGGASCQNVRHGSWSVSAVVQLG